jgi:hypothetical protein
MLVGLMMLTSCGRQPEDQSQDVEGAVEVARPVELELPLNNPTLGITLSELPDGLIASWSDDASIMLVDTEKEGYRFFLEAHQHSDLLEPERYFEDARSRHAGFAQGVQFSTGVVQEAPFGLAMWSACRYQLDGMPYEEIEMMSPHPSGQGLLELRARYPQDRENVADRVEEMNQLLAHVEATNSG